MNQPTEDRFKRLEEEQRQLKEEFRRFKEQQTEPIKITRLEIDSGSMKDDVGVLKIEMQGARADILQVRESQADLRDTLKEHGERLESIEQKQDTHTELLGQLITIGEVHTARFDRIEVNMATKEDISKLRDEMRADIATMESHLLDAMKTLFQQRQEE